MLRVLGQRFPQEVDSAIAKRSRYISKSKAAAAAAAAAAVKDGDKLEVDDQAEAVDRATFEEEAFSSLLVAAFSGAGLASRLPLLRDSEVRFAWDGHRPWIYNCPWPTDCFGGKCGLLFYSSDVVDEDHFVPEHPGFPDLMKK